MLIVVLAEYGGERLLGKAREIADMMGYKVLAICSKKNEAVAQRLIRLGADEVEMYDINAAEEMKQVVNQIIEKRKDIRSIFLPGNFSGNLILGALAASQRERSFVVVDDIDSISEYEITKVLHPSEAALSIKLEEEKVALCSLRLSSVSSPYDDSSRNGSVQTVPFYPKKLESGNEPNLKQLRSSCSELTILVGADASKNPELMSRLQELAKKLHAKITIISGFVQVIYGPCFAIGVESRLGELPEIQGDLTTLNSTDGSPIHQIANLSVISSNFQDVVGEMLKL